MATIYQSTKFHHAYENDREQYYAMAGGYTLLRLVVGEIDDQPGGMIKTATASDFGAAPIYPDRETLVEVMYNGVQELGERTEDIDFRTDEKGRLFSQIGLPGSPGKIMNIFQRLTEKMEGYFI